MELEKWGEAEYTALVLSLKANVDEKYRKFNQGLIPTSDLILGVRLPLLRSMAKYIARGDYRAYFSVAKDDTYEEILLQGLVIGFVKTDLEELLSLVRDFIPKINNWAVCDSFCSGLKAVEKNRAQFFHFLKSYLASNQEFQVRFAVVLLMDYYINEEYIDQLYPLLDEIRQDGYYVKMAIAWAISVCYIKFEEKTTDYLKENHLDDFTYNKALQKIIESNRVSAEKKAWIRGMKRKGSFKS